MLALWETRENHLGDLGLIIGARREPAMKPLVAMAVLILGLATQGCSSIVAAEGIEPTDLSAVEIGAARETVERVLGDPVDCANADDGKLCAYTYNRGRAPVDVGIRPAIIAFSYVISGGMMGFVDAAMARCIKECQKGLIKITYDPNHTVIGVGSGYYDVGDCARGQTARACHNPNWPATY